VVGAVRTAFYYDLFSPEAYLAAERVIALLPAAEWIPVSAPDLPGADLLDGFLCPTDREAFCDRIERLAARRGLQEIRWPDPFPSDTAFAMRVATYAGQMGRAVAFSLAAFRQAFAGGRDLGVPDNVLIAAAACELHPNAVLKAIERQSTKDRLRAATDEAYDRGVRGVPSVVIGDEVFWGDDRLEEAAAALAGS
jgi:2-hydroxychromene-2-carboxylate isomerase